MQFGQHPAPGHSGAAGSSVNSSTAITAATCDQVPAPGTLPELTVRSGKRRPAGTADANLDLVHGRATVIPMTGPTEPKLAPHLRDLPRDKRGYLVPAESPWVGDEPKISKVEPLLRLILAGHRACAVCGYPTLVDEPVWRIYDEFSRNSTHEQIRRDAVTDNDIPGHLVCMLYSALVCPFWRTPGGRLGRDSMFQPGAARGAAPAIMGFNDYGLLIDPSKQLGGVDNGVHVYLEDFAGEIVFSDPLADLADPYDALRQQVGGRYIRHRRRHYAPTFGGGQRLTKEATETVRLLQQHGPEAMVDFEGTPRASVRAGWASAARRR